ncbi:MAG: helix-turn-helix transcriptional regulator [Oscillospiraceae bacterium]|nr:helix-turn-helix transcriptional regulator [Oscillospiraceae bacterium]
MVKLKVKDILEQKGLTRYWLYKQMGMSYQNFNRMINNETKSIKYSNLEALCLILDCYPSDLFEYNPEELE